jgi:pyridoxal phosphate enzyme (YggS family)
MPSIKDQLQNLQSDIETAITSRDTQNIINTDGRISLLAVSKSQPAQSVREAYQAGQAKFGENYLQEALNKQIELKDLNIEWHFIGPIQSNKTQQIAQHFSWVHGVDRQKIAERLNDARPENLPPLQICLQVNISGEQSKSGVAPTNLLALAKALSALPKISLRGLMTIPEPSTDVTLQHDQFRKMRELLYELKEEGFELDTLSMGMSNDYKIAIQEGATIIRIGSAIFGERPVKNK